MDTTKNNFDMSDRRHHSVSSLLRTLLGIAFTMIAAQACQSSKAPSDMPGGSSSTQSAAGQLGSSKLESADRQRDRRQMVDEQLRRRDITDVRVLAAMERVPRHLFVPEQLREAAYEDRPLPIGVGQTISQPYIVALMTELAEPGPNANANEKVLDIGTGSGYQAAILAELYRQVYSIEIIEVLANEARARLEKLGYQNVEVRHGDGYQGWVEHAPFDAILVAAAPDHIPQPLIDQLAPHGRLVIPVGSDAQELLVIEKTSAGEIRQRTVAAVAFVPMTGQAKKK